VTALLATPTATTRFKDYRQQWRLSRYTEPDWKVQYNTTIGTSITASDSNKEVVNVFQEHNSGGGGADIKARQNNDTNIYWEIVVDNTGGRRNISGIRRSEMGIGMDKQLPAINVSDVEERIKDEIQTGRIGVIIDVNSDEKEEKRQKEQESTRSGGMKDLFEQFYELEDYFTGLLALEGKVVLFLLLKSTFRIKHFIKIWNKNMDCIFLLF
jgi:CheY-like chemotaxis protein